MWTKTFRTAQPGDRADTVGEVEADAAAGRARVERSDEERAELRDRTARARRHRICLAADPQRAGGLQRRIAGRGEIIFGDRIGPVEHDVARGDRDAPARERATDLLQPAGAGVEVESAARHVAVERQIALVGQADRSAGERSRSLDRAHMVGALQIDHAIGTGGEVVGGDAAAGLGDRAVIRPEPVIGEERDVPCRDVAGDFERMVGRDRYVRAGARREPGDPVDRAGEVDAVTAIGGEPADGDDCIVRLRDPALLAAQRDVGGPVGHDPVDQEIAGIGEGKIPAGRVRVERADIAGGRGEIDAEPEQVQIIRGDVAAVDRRDAVGERYAPARRGDPVDGHDAAIAVGAAGDAHIAAADHVEMLDLVVPAQQGGAAGRVDDQRADQRTVDRVALRDRAGVGDQLDHVPGRIDRADRDVAEIAEAQVVAVPFRSAAATSFAPSSEMPVAPPACRLAVVIAE